MNPTQFYVSVAVMPITTIIIVLIGVLLNNSNMNSRFAEVNARFGEMDGRFNDINNRLNDMNNRISEMSRQFDARLNDTRDLLRAEISKIESLVLTKFAELDSRLNRIEGR
ncbi:MAG: hypothetical protein HY236_04950 [Acidobacteria bacterium]|nr:hypothetical protein [Acidobacteriota bacterium]